MAAVSRVKILIYAAQYVGQNFLTMKGTSSTQVSSTLFFYTIVNLSDCLRVNNERIMDTTEDIMTFEE